MRKLTCIKKDVASGYGPTLQPQYLKGRRVENRQRMAVEFFRVMNRNADSPGAHVFVMVTLLIICVLSAGKALGQGKVIHVTPGADIEAIVAAAPPGTTFIFAPGTYRQQSIAPQDHDIFSGDRKVVLDGAQVLQFSPADGKNGFWTATATPFSDRHGKCEDTHPLCAARQDLFVDGQLQIQVSTLEECKPGNWYFDIGEGKVYLPIDPQNKMVELGDLSDAFHGDAEGIQIDGIVVEKYANRAQWGAIGADGRAPNWVVRNVEVRWNHGVGCHLGPGAQLVNSFIHDNGQLGVSARGANSQIIGNEIARNNYAGYRERWEAGGAKFWATTDLLVRSNFVHDNFGIGLWTDTNNKGTIYEKNTVENNTFMGIDHEVSFDAIIRDNKVDNNGRGKASWLWNAQILIQNSSNVDVYGNDVTVGAVGGNGIAIINQRRGEWIASNNYVHNNTITYLGSGGLSGFVDDTKSTEGDMGNRFDFNKHIARQQGDHLLWRHIKGWSEVKAEGQEQHGSCCS
jgi:hypothetical protein